jgi:Zn-dependent protease with chaperone function
MEDLQTSSDKGALELVKSTGILPHLVNQFLVKPRDREQRRVLASRGVPLSHFEGLEALVQECAYALCIETLPTVYLINGPGPPNAFTFGGDDSPVMVMDSGLPGVMGADELRALFWT